MTFEEWLRAQPPLAEDDAVSLAECAWKAALAEATRTARETARRYTCNKRRALCEAIAVAIERTDAK